MMHQASNSSKPLWISDLAKASAKAQVADFASMRDTCALIAEQYGQDASALVDVGTLLLNFGYINDARNFLAQAEVLCPHNISAKLNLANAARDSGDHALSNDLYLSLLEAHPHNPVIRRNVLVSQQYHPEVNDVDALKLARAWGDWAIDQAGGPRLRPPIRPLFKAKEKQTSHTTQPLRVGYVSGDFCQHTVGLFVKHIIKAHQQLSIYAQYPIEVFAYSNGQVTDWVTQEIKSACTLREVHKLNDLALATQIQQDQIDVLVDLSGHTAGSRLTVFAHRPAPVQISWLGYFATTGLKYIDAVLLDEYHAPEGTEAQFVEKIIHLKGGRLCYQPVPWAPEVSPSPYMQKGHIRFGSFNNTSKLNSKVFDVWANILKAIPSAQLVLKWRTLVDDTLKKSIHRAFTDRGVSVSQIEIRPASFHVDVLKEYADIDIALDPFPFTGGLTSCEALWMGVPVITWPQSRMVSRQTFALLNQIGLPELAAKDAEDYVRISVELANNLQLLMQLRQTLRQRMQASPLCDVAGFTQNLEKTIINLYGTLANETPLKPLNPMTSTAPKILLNIGAGHPKSGARIPDAFHSAEWKEVRLDIDPANEPDVIGTMLDMSAMADESADALYSSHTIEHLYPNEIPQAIKEFLRVLKPQGYAVITCPDLQAAAEMIALDKLMETAYTTGSGMVVTPFDIVYSHREYTGRDKPYMAHHCGFTLKVLNGTLRSNGFASVVGKRRARGLDLWVVATKQQMDEGALRELAGKVLPG